MADPFPDSLHEVEQSQAHPGPLGEDFAEALGEYSGSLEALSPQSKKGESLDMYLKSGAYLAMTTLSTLEISVVISAISTSWSKDSEQLQAEGERG